MNKLVFLLLPLSLITFSSCNFNIKPGTLTVDKDNITIYSNQDARIVYKTTNGQKARARSNNNQIIQVYDDSDFTRFNNYIYITNQNLNSGTTTLTISANNTNSVTINITVKEPPSIRSISNVSKDEALTLIDEAIANEESEIRIKNISGISSISALKDNLELLDGHAEFIDLNNIDKEGYHHIVFSYYDFGYLYHETSISFKNVINANSYVRNKKRSLNRTSLPIDELVGLDFEVNNSESLFWAVEHGYKPIIKDNTSSVYKCYQKARDICLTYIDDSMNNLEKARAAYEWILANTQYNYYIAQELNEQDDFTKYVDYYLEGPLLYGSGVCDAFAKTFALLMGIEQVNTIDETKAFRSFGYTSDSGHAWNYLVENNKAYLICPTWGKITFRKSDSLNPFNEDVGVTSYMSFMTTKNYFKDQGGSNYSDLAIPSIIRAESMYKFANKCPLELDVIDNHSYRVESKDDADNIVKSFKDSNLNKDFSFNVISSRYRRDIEGKYISDAIEKYYPNAHNYSVAYSSKSYQGYYWITGMVNF